MWLESGDEALSSSSGCPGEVALRGRSAVHTPLFTPKCQ